MKKRRKTLDNKETERNRYSKKYDSKDYYNEQYIKTNEEV